nr:ABC transporter substrate-binding protein [Tissierella sp.]
MKKSKVILLILILSLALSTLTGCASKDKEEAEKPAVDLEVGKDKEEDKEEDKEKAEAPDEEDDYGITIEEDSVKFIDGRGEEVAIKKNPEKTIVLFSSYIDIWMKHGGELAGIVEPSEGYVVAGTEGIPTVGKQGSFSLEEIIALEPDLVVISANTKSQMELIPALESNNIEVLVLDYKFKEDYFKTAKVFAAINDSMDLYEQEAKRVKEETQAIIDRAPEENNPKVLIMFATKKSLSARTSDSTTGEIFNDLNAINIADSSNDMLGEKSFSMEKILEEDPDFIFVQTMGSDTEAIQERIEMDAESNPAWGSLSAIKNKKYIVLPKDLYTYKANDRYAEAYGEIAKTLYPDLFK